MRKLGANSCLIIDISALVANWRVLAAASATAETAAVVKADAYGLGMLPVARALAAAGCHTFFVANVSEGLALRSALPVATIYVLHGISGSAVADFIAHNLRPVLNSLADVQRWTTAAPAAPAALHVDTGMNRLGLPAAEFLALAAAPLTFNLCLLLSHCVESEQPNSPTTLRQIESFKALAAHLLAVPASLANSCGIYIPAARHQLTRPGIALYGGNPTPDRQNPMRQPVTLRAPILQMRQITAGESAGYCSTFTATRPSVLATCAIGYADGWLRSGSNTAQAMVAGQRCPLVGNISMDLIIVDVTDVPAGKLASVADVTLLGEELTVDDVASSMGTISYEFLTRLGPRLTRSYING